MECISPVKICGQYIFQYVFNLEKGKWLSFTIFFLYAFYNSFISLILSKINQLLLNASILNIE